METRTSILGILLLFTVFSGCKNSEETDLNSSEVKVEEDQAEYDEKFTISEEGVGLFKLNSSINDLPEDPEIEKTIRTRLAEGMEIKETVYVVSEDGKEQLLLKSNTTGNGKEEVIKEIFVVSDNFKTEEGIGVNSTLAEFRKAYPENKIWYTYVSDRYVAETPELEEVQFLLEEDGFSGEMEISSAQVPLSASDFKEGTKIKKIRLY